MFAGTPPPSPSVVSYAVINTPHTMSNPSPLPTPHYNSFTLPSPHATDRAQHLQSSWDVAHQITPTYTSEFIERAEPVSSTHRSDGRRSVDLEQSSVLNQASKLYGKPSWWGEEKDVGVRAPESEYVTSKYSSHIMKEMEHEGGGLGKKEKESVPFKLSNKDELRMQAISNSRQPECMSLISPPSVSSWVIDLRGGGSGGGTNTMPRIRRSREHESHPRSADPSPNRLRAKRDISPLPNRPINPTATVKRRSSLNSPVRTRKTTPTPSTASPKHRAGTPPVTTLQPTRRERGTTPPVGSNLSSPTHRQRATTSPRSMSPLRRRGTTSASHRSAVSSNKPAAADGKQTKKLVTMDANSSKTQAMIPKNASSKPKSSQSRPEPNSVSHATTKSVSPRHAMKGTSSHLTPAVKEKSESGDQTYVVAAVSDDSVSLSSLSDPGASSEQEVVVATESVAKIRNRSARRERVEEKEERGGKREGRHTQTNSMRKEWIDDDVQVCVCVCMHMCACISTLG